MYRIVTNNSLCRDKYQELIPVDFLEGKGYMDVLLAVRDYIQKGWRLETHPMTGSLKPNQTPYRSVVVYPQGEDDNMKDIMLIEKCIETYRQWQDIAPTPEKYADNVAYDFQTIDLSVIDNIIPRIS